jgi:hypothetical protein
VAKLEYFRTIVANQNYIYVEVNSRLIPRIIEVNEFRILCIPVCYQKYISRIQVQNMLLHQPGPFGDDDVIVVW